MNDWVRKTSRQLADAFGSPWAFVVALLFTIL
jgi:low affinity Fe/Cu permease